MTELEMLQAENEQLKERAEVAELALKCAINSYVYDGDLYSECECACNECEHECDIEGCIDCLYKLALKEAEARLNDVKGD